MFIELNDQLTVFSPPVPDTARPTLKFTNKKKLKPPKAKHTIKGIARDNVAVAKVEVKVRGKKGWRKAKLRADGKWKFKTQRLKAGRNVAKFRAEDSSGNRSRVKRVRATGK